MHAVRLAGRAYMVRPLVSLPSRVRAPSGYRIRPFDPARLDELARIQWAAYHGTPDRMLFPDALGTPRACLAHLHTLLNNRHPWAFSPGASQMLMQGDAPVGFILTSLGPNGSSSVDNIAVHPHHRGGAGRALLMDALIRLQRAGATCAALTVTCANVAAMRLYEHCQFLEAVRLPTRLPANQRRDDP